MCVSRRTDAHRHHHIDDNLRDKRRNGPPENRYKLKSILVNTNLSIDTFRLHRSARNVDSNEFVFVSSEKLNYSLFSFRATRHCAAALAEGCVTTQPTGNMLEE